MTTTNHTSPSGEELLPCPFCGAAAATHEKGKGASWYPTVHCVNWCCDIGGTGGTRESMRKDAARRWNTRAALTAEKVAGQEPVGEVTATVLEGADQGVIGWYGDPLPVKSVLYAAPQQPAQSAEQDERALTEVGFIVHDDLHGWHFAPTVAWTYLGKGRALYARAASTQSSATQPVQAEKSPDGRTIDKAMVKRLAVQYGLIAEGEAQAERALTIENNNPATQKIIERLLQDDAQPVQAQVAPAGWFVQRSKFGLWVEVEQQEPGAEQFYRIAAQPAKRR